MVVAEAGAGAGAGVVAVAAVVVVVVVVVAAAAVAGRGRKSSTTPRNFRRLLAQQSMKELGTPEKLLLFCACSGHCCSSSCPKPQALNPTVPTAISVAGFWGLGEEGARLGIRQVMSVKVPLSFGAGS